MSAQRDRMLHGARYDPYDPDLVADRQACRRLVAAFNDTAPDDDGRRRDLLGQLLGSFGAGSVIMPRFCCDYGTHISIGVNCFINYDAIMLDCAPITIGDQVSIGPRAQLVTALHPIDDIEARRAGWESAAPITIGDNAWLAAGVIVCPGVSIGADTVVGAGSVVTRDLPPGVLAAGNPCRVIRSLG